jgi:hypothetical protein
MAMIAPGCGQPGERVIAPYVDHLGRLAAS